MRDTILTINNIGTITHARSLDVGDTQSMILLPTYLPPIFHPDVPQYDEIKEGEDVTRKLNKAEIKEKLGAMGYNADGNVRVLKQRVTEANVPLYETKSKIIPGYVGKPKDATQITCKVGVHKR